MRCLTKSHTVKRIYLYVFCFLGLLCATSLNAQQVLSEHSFLSNQRLHNGNHTSACHGFVAIGATSPVNNSVSWRGAGTANYGNSGSRNASIIQSAGNVNQPMTVRRVDGWEDDDDDDDDNWTSTGGQGDGNGNAGDPEKDPVPIDNSWIVLLFALIYALLLCRNGRNSSFRRKYITHNIFGALRQRICFSWFVQSDDTLSD